MKHSSVVQRRRHFSSFS